MFTVKIVLRSDPTREALEGMRVFAEEMLDMRQTASGHSLVPPYESDITFGSEAQVYAMALAHWARTKWTAKELVAYTVLGLTS